MLSPDEIAERRALQAKAYGREGKLSLEEGARLRELERQRRAAASGAVSADESAVSAGAGPATPPAAGPGPHPVAEFAAPDAAPRARATRPVAEPGEGSGPGQRSVAQFEASAETSDRGEASDAAQRAPADPAEASAAPGASRIRRLWPFIAAAAALVVGVAAGWALWGFNSEAFQLASAHSAKQAELESAGEYDPGSVVAVAEQHGVVVWIAQREEGEQQCVVLTSEAVTNSGCGTAEGAYSGTAGATITVPEGDELAGQTFSAYLVRSAADELVPTVQIWDPGATNWEAQFSDDELAAIDRLEEAGYSTAALNILGYDGDRPIWFAWDAQGICLIAETDAGVLEGCAAEVESGGELTVEADIDGIATQYLLTYGEMRGPQLTVMKLPSAQQPAPDAPEINDTTGESTP